MLMGGLIGIIMDRGSIWQIISWIISSTVVVLLVLPVHEFAHGLAATKLGDPTPGYQGRMSLNPMRHIDYLGSLLIFLIGFGWAKPVQVDARYFKNPKGGMAITALAGPLSNIIVAFISSFLYSALRFVYVLTLPYGFWLSVINFFALVFYYITIINISLAVFNLVPIPPLDGSKILAVLLPDRIYYQLMRYERYFMIVLMALLFYGSSFSSFLDRIDAGVYSIFQYVTWLPFSLILGA